MGNILGTMAHLCRAPKGAAKCPLTYIFCKHDLVTNAIHAVNYPDHDSRLVASTTLAGPWYEIDNHRINDDFKALVLKGPGWSFVKAFDCAKDGRGAVLTLKRQCEGTSAIQSRKVAAYAKISTAQYNGKSKLLCSITMLKSTRGLTTPF